MNKHSELRAGSPLPLQSLEKMLAPLTDQRAPRGVRYGLLPLLCIVLLAKLTGADTPTGIADWATDRAAWLRAQLHLNWRRMPHHSTFRRLFQQATRTASGRVSERAPGG